MSGPPGAFPVPSVGNKEIKKPCSNENRAKITLLTTYCCILTYEFPLTAESPGTLTFQKQYRFQGSASSSGVIFLSRKSTGLPSSPARFGFLLVNLLSPSWLFSMDRLNATIESVHSYVFFTFRQNNDVGVKRSFAPFDTGLFRTTCFHNPQNIHNPLIFLRKMATYSCFRRVPRSKILLQASLHQISDLLTLVSY